MAWIRTVRAGRSGRELAEGDGRSAVLYPVEIRAAGAGARPGLAGDRGLAHADPAGASSCVLRPSARLMSPDLPLARRQHEMIATMVSLTNKCHY